MTSNDETAQALSPDAATGRGSASGGTNLAGLWFAGAGLLGSTGAALGVSRRRTNN